MLLAHQNNSSESEINAKKLLAELEEHQEIFSNEVYEKLKADFVNNIGEIVNIVNRHIQSPAELAQIVDKYYKSDRSNTDRAKISEIQDSLNLEKHDYKRTTVI